MNLCYKDCWAKTTSQGIPGLGVYDHCINVGCVAAALLDRLPPRLRALLPQNTATLAALHDVGKLSPGFQQKCDVWARAHSQWFKPQAGYETRHQLISQFCLNEISGGKLRHWAEVLGAHHGRIQGNDPPGSLGTPDWHDARVELVKALEHAFGALPDEDASSDAVKWLVAGLITVSDWLGSDEKVFSEEGCKSVSKEYQRARAEEFICRLELAGSVIDGGKKFEEVFAKQLRGNPPRSLQKQLIDLPDPALGIYIIEDEMGSGKTEAALWLAYRLLSAGEARGLYFALPTRMTSDRIHRRVQDFLSVVYPDGIAPPLVHGHAWLREMPSICASWQTRRKEGGQNGRDGLEEEDPEEHMQDAQRWFASTRRGLLAPFAVGTIDQALLGIIAAKWFFIRQFALAGKVVVLDEVHSYDLYTGTLISHLVKRLCEQGATPVILSATLTEKQRADLLGESDTKASIGTPYPSLTIRAENSPPKTVAINQSKSMKVVRLATLTVPDYDSVASVVALAAEFADGGNNVVWIRNTVRQAQDAFRMLKSVRREGGFEVGLLHSRFPAFQRGSYPHASLETLERKNLHEERWLWMLGRPEPPREDIRPKGSVLVGTQVIEQSVDIDADVMITDLAPTDMLLQRLGRLHRHERGNRGEATIYLTVPQSLAEGGDDMSAAELKRCLGKSSRVYDPYVLVRSWEQWQKLSDISIPNDIRKVLEATYADRENDPMGWLELRQEMLSAKQRLENMALTALDVRGQPLCPDDGEVVTRFFSQKQISLLILRWCSPDIDRAGNPDELHLLNCQKLNRNSYREFNLNAARSLYLNTVSIPAWWLPRSIRKTLPAGIAQYFDGNTVMAVWDGRSEKLKLSLRNADLAPVICYTPEYGLWLETAPRKESFNSDYDGEDDDGMF